MSFRSFAGASVSAGGGVPAGASASTAQGWHPTVLYLCGLLVVEFVVVGFLTRYLLKGE